MSLKLKINLLLLCLGILSSLAIATFNYTVEKEQVFKQAFSEAEIISNFGMAARRYTVETMRPIAMSSAQGFHPEIMGGFFVARGIADLFSQAQPGYSFKQAALNPVNPQNKADAQEEDIIRYFQANPGVAVREGLMDKAGKKYFFVAKPVKVEASCMTCHGSKDTAFPGRVSRYPGDGGYNYKVGGVEATFINYVPIQKALDKVKATAVKTAMAGVISILVIVLAVWLFVQYFITKPIVNLTTTADAISHGQGLETELAAPSKDEIGDLYNAFNRMRVSVLKMKEMVLRKK